MNLPVKVIASCWCAASGEVKINAQIFHIFKCSPAPEHLIFGYIYIRCAVLPPDPAVAHIITVASVVTQHVAVAYFSEGSSKWSRDCVIDSCHWQTTAATLPPDPAVAHIARDGQAAVLRASWRLCGPLREIKCQNAWRRGENWPADKAEKRDWALECTWEEKRGDREHK